MSIVVIVVVVAAGLGYYAFIANTPSRAASVSSSSASIQTSSQPFGAAPSTSTQSTSSMGTGSVSSTGQLVCGIPAKGAKIVSLSMDAGSNQPFSPETVVVVVIGINNTVMWTNDDMNGDVHTVTSRAGLFDSGSMAAGVTFTCAFTTVGSFDYFSRNNPAMVGTVIVKSR